MSNTNTVAVVDVRHRFRFHTSDFWQYSRGVLADNNPEDIERAKKILAEPYGPEIVHDYEIVETALKSK